MSSRLSDKIIGNTFFSGLGYVWDILIVRLVVWAYVFQCLPTRDFGVWVYISLLVGYFSFMGFSVDSAFVKHISQHYTDRDHDAINRVVNTGLVFYGVVGLLVVLAVQFTACGFLADTEHWFPEIR